MRCDSPLSHKTSIVTYSGTPLILSPMGQKKIDCKAGFHCSRNPLFSLRSLKKKNRLIAGDPLFDPTDQRYGGDPLSPPRPATPLTPSLPLRKVLFIAHSYLRLPLRHATVSLTRLSSVRKLLRISPICLQSRKTILLHR